MQNLIEKIYAIYKKYPSVQTDTRKLKTGDIFFALKGPNFNANSFALQALEMGAACSVVDENIAPDNDKIIVVENVLETLQLLAKHHRQQFNIPFIAITGSNGKTTTKELVATVLASHYKTYTTQGNLNNHIGIPLTILSVMPDAEIAVIEMGANHQKEIESYCNYTLPTHGIITNCGKAHLEGFGGIEGVKKGKGELYDYLRKSNGTIFLFEDYDYLQTMSNGLINRYSYGTTRGNIQGSVISSEPFLSVDITSGADINILDTHLVGSYNLPNVLCAIAIGKFFLVPDEKIKAAIESYIPSNSRSQLVNHGLNKIILDAYNANPTSMKAAIENFAELHANDKWLFLGGMMEMGNESIAEHRAIVELLQKLQFKNVVLVGGDYRLVDHAYLFFKTSSEAGTWLKQNPIENAHILIKGSRSMQMEKILE